MTNQRGELEACAAVLMALDCKLEVRLDNMWVKTGVEPMLSWVERKKQPTFRPEHTSVVESDLGKTCADSKRPCHTQTCPRSSWLVRRGSRNSQRENWEGNMAADEQAKEGATKSEPPQQMMSEYVQRRHMIPDAQMAAVHILGWGCIVPEAK